MKNKELRSRYDVKIYKNDDVEVDVAIKEAEDVVAIMCELMYMCLKQDFEMGAEIIEEAKELAVARIAEDTAENFLERHDISKIDSISDLLHLVADDLKNGDLV